MSYEELQSAARTIREQTGRDEHPVAIVLGILALSVLLVGLWPAPLVDMMNASIEHLVQQLGQSKL